MNQLKSSWTRIEKLKTNDVGSTDAVSPAVKQFFDQFVDKNESESPWTRIEKLKTNYQRPDALTTAVTLFFGQFVEQVNDIHITTTLPIELTNATGTNLDHLNDDCLREIFSQNSLTAMDLCALAETCKLFERTAQRVFPKTLRIYKDRPEDSEYLITLNGDEREIIASARDVERILKKFGSSLTAIAVDGARNIINLVAKHCVVGTLKGLGIGRIKITDVLAVELQPIFRQLQELTIIDTSIQCGAHVFANCDLLIQLTVIEQDLNRYHPIMQNNYPKLRRFTSEDFCSGSDSAEMLNFLERHKTLKCLHLPTLRFNGNEKFFLKLGNSCKELEELTISFFKYCGAPTLNFSIFKSLKRLKLFLSFEDEPMVVRLKNAKALQILEISGWFDTENLMADLPFLKNLHELSLHFPYIKETVQWKSLPQLTKLTLSSDNSLPINYVVDVIREMRNLQELVIIDPHKFVSAKEFYEIVKMTRGRRNVLTLKCRNKFSRSGWIYKKI